MSERYSPEHRLCFEIFDARPRTKRLRQLVIGLYWLSEHSLFRQPFDWLGDRTDDLCRWDLMRQYRDVFGNDDEPAFRDIKDKGGEQ